MPPSSLGEDGALLCGEARAPDGLLPKAPPLSPAPALRVRNTFLDAAVQRSPSLERFLEPRLVRSTPTTPSGEQTGSRLQVVTDLDEQALPSYLINTPTESVRDGLLLTPRGEAQTWPRPCSPVAQPRGLQPAPQALCLLKAIGLQPEEVPAADAAEALPSRGSALHRYGACRPCAFIHREGCRSGSECQFCHLCDPGERKARKKERLASRREETRGSAAARPLRLGGC